MAIDINLGLSAIATGTADVITATYSPAPTLVDKKILFLRCSGANTTTPTFNPNSLGAKSIVKQGGVALQAGDLVGANFVAILMYDLSNTRWELLNPKGVLDLTGVAGTYVTAGMTIQTALTNLDSILYSAVLNLGSKQETLYGGSNISNIDNNNIMAGGTILIAREVQFACSDETTALTASSGTITFRMPRAATVTDVRASLTTAQASGNILTIDINEDGVSILSTKLTIDNTEKTSVTAATPVVISDADIADDAEMTVDIDQIGDGTATGLKVTIYYTIPEE